MCSSELVAPYIRNIGINTQAPRHTTICEPRRKLRKKPSADPQGFVGEFIELLSAALREYDSLCSGGGVIDGLQIAFENLRKNQNTALILEILDDGDGRCVGYKQELDIPYTISETEDPEGLLRCSGIFCFDQRNQSRVLLALARSGLSLEQLRISPKAHAWAHPWNEICDDLKRQDDITMSFRCDDLSHISVNKVHIVIDLDCESWKQMPNIVFQDRSALHCLIRCAKGLRCLELEGSYYAGQVDTGQLLRSLPLRGWRHVRLAYLSMRASDLFQFRLTSRLSLDDLELNNIELITERGHPEDT